MIYEYAVEPTFFAIPEYSTFILEAFGQEKGRLISDTKDGLWAKWANNAITKKTIPPLEKAKLHEVLKMLKIDLKAVYKRKCSPADTWTELTKTNHKSWPYRGILVEKNQGDNEEYLSHDISLCKKQNWINPPSVTVDRESKTMLSVSIPLLNLSKKIILVDRNFRLKEKKGLRIYRFENVLLSFLEYLAAKKYGPPVDKLTYHISTEPPEKKMIESYFLKTLKEKLPKGIKIKFVIWPKNDLHDRYLLTEWGCLKYGIGLDEQNDNNVNKVTITRLSSQDHKNFLQEFSQKENAENNEEYTFSIP